MFTNVMLQKCLHEFKKFLLDAVVCVPLEYFKPSLISQYTLANFSIYSPENSIECDCWQSLDTQQQLLHHMFQLRSLTQFAIMECRQADGGVIKILELSDFQQKQTSFRRPNFPWLIFKGNGDFRLR